MVPRYTKETSGVAKIELLKLTETAMDAVLNFPVADDKGRDYSALWKCISTFW